MINKDFLKAVLTGDKSLLRLDQVSRINVPLYDELAVGKLWPMFKDDTQFMQFFPTKMAKGRLPDGEYTFNIMNTFYPKYVGQIIKHANEQRNSVAGETQANEAIEVTDEWWDALNAIPFKSCKKARNPRGTNFLLFFVQKAKEGPSTC